MKIITYKEFGLPTNPWQSVQIETADSRRIQTMVASAINDQAFVSILGQRGSGKSYSINNAIAQAPETKVVDLLRLDRHKLSMGDIIEALIRELSDESPRRSGEARSAQVKRILGEASRRHNIVLMIDDSHVLHHQTLRSLKRLREFSWLNKSPLLGIVLIGQKDKTQGIAEVQLRSDHMWLQGLTTAEIKRAITQAMGNVFDSEAIAQIAKSSLAKNWLDLQDICSRCLVTARASGAKQVTRDIVQQTLNPRVATQDNAPSDADIANHLNNKKLGGRRAA